MALYWRNLEFLFSETPACNFHAEKILKNRVKRKVCQALFCKRKIFGIAFLHFFLDTPRFLFSGVPVSKLRSPLPLRPRRRGH